MLDTSPRRAVSLVARGGASAISPQIGDLRQIQTGRYGGNEDALPPRRRAPGPAQSAIDN